eukprot:5974758-Pyramimonas_sp.AAC.3
MYFFAASSFSSSLSACMAIYASTASSRKSSSCSSMYFAAAAVPLGASSLSLGGEGLIVPVRLRILFDRGGADRILVLPDVFRDRHLDEPPLAVLDALQPVAQLVPDAAVRLELRARCTFIPPLLR